MAAKEAVKEFIVDLNGWKVRQFRDYIAAVGANDFDTMSALIGLAVKQWPYEGDPSDPEAVLDLRLPDLVEIAKQVGKEMSASFSQGE